MSWDADLVGEIDGHPVHLRGWNYTHNTSRMVYAILRRRETWWGRLNGMTGLEAQAYLGRIIDSLAADPDKFRAMNPENGWGDYDSFLNVLMEMRAAACKFPSARWETSG